MTSVEDYISDILILYSLPSRSIKYLAVHSAIIGLLICKISIILLHAGVGLETLKALGPISKHQNSHIYHHFLEDNT